ncbi:MAG: sugar transferase, partial [Methylococcaceae bacterium]
TLKRLFLNCKLENEGCHKIDLNDFGSPQRTEFPVGEWNVSAPVLRYLPRILAVISGDLSFMGSLPVSLEAAEKRIEEWERLADQTPSGLLGPTQLNIPADASEEEKLMSDSFYAAHFNFRNNALCLLKSFQALISSKAWIS